MKELDDKDFLRFLEGKLSAAEFDEFVGNLEDEDNRHALMDQMDIVYSRIENEDSSALRSGARNSVYKSMERRIRIKRIWKSVVNISLLAGCLLLGLFSWKYFQSLGFEELEYREFAVEAGQRPALIVFQEGTHITLNSGSTLKYPTRFDDDCRKVSLSGEAYFKVAHDSKRPFTVDMDNYALTVRGTSFNVKNYEQDKYSVVTLDEGAVDIIHKDTIYQLQPQQTAVYDRISDEFKVHPGSSLSTRNSLWKDNVIFFHKTPLQDVLPGLSRWYNVDFEIIDSTVCGHSFTFTSGFVPLDSLLHDLESISYLKFRHNGDRVEVYSSSGI